MEYVNYVLYRHVYHCKPTELGEIPMPMVMETLAVMNAEAKVEAMRAKKKPKKR